MPLTLDPKTSLADLVFNANDPDSIIDAFCFVVGYTTGEIRRRITEHIEMAPIAINDVAQLSAYQARLDQIETAWAAFVAATPDRAAFARVQHTEGWIEQQREAARQPT